MAGGWSRDGAVQDQIEDSLKDAVQLARSLMPRGEGAEDCDNCGEQITLKRREAIPGVRTSSNAKWIATQPCGTRPSIAEAARTANCAEKAEAHGVAPYLGVGAAIMVPTAKVGNGPRATPGERDRLERSLRAVVYPTR